MSERFNANPDVLRAEGNSINDKAQQFGQNIEKIYATVEEMIGSSYLSPGSRAIANQIQTYRDDLNKMARVINDYGDFCLFSDHAVVNNEQNIIDNAKANSSNN